MVQICISYKCAITSRHFRHIFTKVVGDVSVDRKSHSSAFVLSEFDSLLVRFCCSFFTLAVYVTTKLFSNVYGGICLCLFLSVI